MASHEVAAPRSSVSRVQGILVSDGLLRSRQLGFLVLGLLTVVLGGLASQYTTIIDDGAITLRYVERLSGGKGFSYNDDEFVNGASNPMFTLILAAANLALKNLPMSLSLVAILLLVWTLLGSSQLLMARAHPFAALLFVFLFSSNYFLIVSYFNGMESGLTCGLIALLLLAVYSNNERWTGIALGLLVANKLDGALAALVFAGLYLIKERRFPVKVAAWAFAAALPVAIVLFAHFGSVIPQSMVSKMFGPAHKIVSHFEPLWMLKLIYGASPQLVWIFAFSLLGLLARRTFADVFLLCFLAAYLAAYSLVNLGDKYPWYAVPALYMMILAASVYLGHLFSRLRSRAPLDRLHPLVSEWAVLCISVLLAGGSIVSSIRGFNWSAPLEPYARGDLSRAAAGAWLRREARPSETLLTGWGLPALEFKGPTVDEAALTSRFDKVADIKYVVREFRMGQRPFPQLGGEDVNNHLSKPKTFYLTASFEIPDASEFYAIYSSDDSSIFKRFRGAPETSEQTAADLPLTKNDENLLGNKVMKLDRTDLFAHAPFDATARVADSPRRFLAFTPEFSPGVAKKDGVTFRVEVNGVSAFEQTILPHAPSQRIRIALTPTPAGLSDIRLQTSPQKDIDYDWAWFRNLRIRSGSAMDLLTLDDFTMLNERQRRVLQQVDLPYLYSLSSSSLSSAAPSPSL